MIFGEKTKAILNNIKTKKNKIEDKHFIEEEYYIKIINKKIKEKNIRKSVLIKKALLDDKNGYKYFDGKLKMKRDILLKLLISLECTLEEIQDTLKKSQFAILYPCNKRDYTIILGIENNKDCETINKDLELNNEVKL